MIGYLHNILITYVNTTRDSLKLSKTHPAMVIFDTFKSQTTPSFLETLEKIILYNSKAQQVKAS